jgi:hypothetical protein
MARIDDARLREVALQRMRAALGVDIGGTPGWHSNLDKAAKWALIAEALRPDDPKE